VCGRLFRGHVCAQHRAVLFARCGAERDPGVSRRPAGAEQGSLQSPIKASTAASYNFTVERWLGLNNLGQIDKHHTYPNAKYGRWFQFDSLGRVRVAKNVQRNPEALPGGCPNPDFGLSTATCTPPADYLLVGTPDTMAYDAVGNRTDKGGAYTTGNRMTAFNSCTYTTDADGNMTGRSGGGCASPATFYWNKEGQLDSMIAGANRVHLLYDADGRLVQKKLNGTSQAWFLWDGANLLAELNGTASAKVAEYSYYPGLDNLHALVVGTSAYYAHEDFLGNVIALTDSAQGVKRTYGYDDWGKVTSGSDNLPFSNADRARWKGALWLGPEVDVYYMRNRWYEPATGRFLSEDPIGLAGGINPVVFAGADPVAGADPEGLIDTRSPWGSWSGRWGTLPFTPLGLPQPPGSNGELLKRQGGGGNSVRAYSGSPMSRRPRRTPKEAECRGAKLELAAAIGSDALVLLPLAKAYQLTMKSGTILAYAGKGGKAAAQRGAARAFAKGRDWVEVAMGAEVGSIFESHYALIGNSEEFTWRTAISWVPVLNSGFAAWDVYLACK
jgi:RHS repeat-associated protein